MFRSLVIALFMGLVLCHLSIGFAATSQSTYFSTLPPHAPLPSDATCAQQVHQSAWEPRPENTTANNTVPTAEQLASFHSQPLDFPDGPPASDFQAVDGNYTGTTDMIIQWAACKWGMDENILRAEAFLESTWTASTTGDFDTNETGCAAGLWDGWQPQGYCWQSYGISQIKVDSYNAWPMAWTSTAFNLDFRAAYWRACMNGDTQYYYYDTASPGYPAYSASGNVSQMAQGCMGSWFSGNWYDASALSYISAVKALLKSKPWVQLPVGTNPSLEISTPLNNQTVSGEVAVNISLNQADPNACYSCLSIDGVHQTCTPAAGPWTWNTLQNVLDGSHSIQVDAYTCSGAGPKYHAAVNVTVSN